MNMNAAGYTVPLVETHSPTQHGTVVSGSQTACPEVAEVPGYFAPHAQLRAVDSGDAPSHGSAAASSGPGDNPGRLLRARYHALSRLVHPDKCAHPLAQHAFAAVSKAYAISSASTCKPSWTPSSQTVTQVQIASLPSSSSSGAAGGWSGPSILQAGLSEHPQATIEINEHPVNLVREEELSGKDEGQFPTAPNVSQSTRCRQHSCMFNSLHLLRLLYHSGVLLM
eukprot:scaffold209791_cov42-Prasinocladus_malaysianus.AAC.2